MGSGVGITGLIQASPVPGMWLRDPHGHLKAEGYQWNRAREEVHLLDGAHSKGEQEILLFVCVILLDASAHHGHLHR